MKGTIFDIQRFSVHDGPGIRTTVFMKGCPLRCKWCHNPEGLSKEITPQFFEEKCIGCGRCGGRRTLSEATVCPSEAISVSGWEASEDEVIEEVLKDRNFYGNEGGVTFSGGECLLQADFVASVLKKLKSMGIHTAVDTCGYVRWEEMAKTLDYCDVYLYDIKCVTASLHKEYTGVDNTLIIENLKKLSQCGKEIIARVPLIPGFNTSKEELEKIACLASELPSVKQATLIPYHTLGAGKYKTLGMQYDFDTTLRITEQELTAARKLFEAKGIGIV